MLEKLFNWRFWPLFFKELNEIRRNRRLVGMMLVPPTLNLVLLGFAMNPEVTDMRLGIVDESRTAESRELISAFTESKSFVPAGHFRSIDELTHALSDGELEAGLIVASDFATKRVRGEVADVQFLVDSVNSNTGSIAGGYAARIIGALNERVSLHKSSVPRVESRVSLFYNAGCKTPGSSSRE